MTSSNPVVPLDDLKADALLLADGASQLYHGVASEELDEAFSAALTRTLQYDAKTEVAVMTAALEALRDQQDHDAASWLIGEAELEAECQYLESPYGDEMMAVLFAIPIIFQEGTPHGELSPIADIERLHTLMEQAEIVSATARFGLLPFLLSPETLEYRAYAEIAETTRYLGQQVADGEGPVLRLGHCLPGAVPHELTDQVTVRYLLGVAVAKDNGEDPVDLFWEEPENDAQAFANWSLTRSETSQFHPRGTLPDGELWEDAFADALTENTAGEQPVLMVGNPLGFHEDRYMGRVLQREQALVCQFQAWLASGKSINGARITQQPVKDANHELCGWIAWLALADGECLQLSWPLLEQETEEDAYGLFQDVLDDLHLLPENARSLLQQAPGRQRLH